jgi:aspartate 1-decarboxylase
MSILNYEKVKQFRKQEYISIIKGEMERLGLVKKKLNHHTCVGEANGYNEPCGECVIITSYNQAISDQISHLQSELLLIEKDNG